MESVCSSFACRDKQAKIVPHRLIVLMLMVGLAILVVLPACPQAPAGRPSAQSPAARKPPASKEQQSYPAAQVQAGEARFVAECGFCHGRDAEGGETGP